MKNDSVMLIVNSILLIFTTMTFSYTLARRLRKKKVQGQVGGQGREAEKIERLQKAIKRVNTSMSIKMGFAEKIEIQLIDRSNIRYYVPIMNFKLLVLCCIAIFVAAFQPIYQVLYFIPSTMILCGTFALVPVLILELLGRYNAEKIRRRLAEFVSILNRWCAVKEDIFYAFEKSLQSGIGEPLKTYIHEMTVQIQRGIDPMEALDILQLKVDNIQFKDFIVNIKQNIRFRGNITCLLTNLETQLYRLEEEYSRRKISTYKDKMLIFVLMGCVLLIGYFFLKLNPRVMEYYLSSLQGKALLGVFVFLYAGGCYFSLGISKFKY